MIYLIGSIFHQDQNSMKRGLNLLCHRFRVNEQNNNHHSKPVVYIRVHSFFKFYQIVVDLQCCVKCQVYSIVIQLYHIYSLFFRFFPYSSFQNTEQSSLCFFILNSNLIIWKFNIKSGFSQKKKKIIRPDNNFHGNDWEISNQAPFDLRGLMDFTQQNDLPGKPHPPVRSLRGLLNSLDRGHSRKAAFSAHAPHAQLQERYSTPPAMKRQFSLPPPFLP